VLFLFSNSLFLILDMPFYITMFAFFSDHFCCDLFLCMSPTKFNVLNKSVLETLPTCRYFIFS
jgi:hypothetical protein